LHITAAGSRLSLPADSVRLPLVLDEPLSANTMVREEENTHAPVAIYMDSALVWLEWRIVAILTVYSQNDTIK